MTKKYYTTYFIDKRKCMDCEDLFSKSTLNCKYFLSRKNLFTNKNQVVILNTHYQFNLIFKYKNIK